jgi:hypothetical protein
LKKISKFSERNSGISIKKFFLSAEYRVFKGYVIFSLLISLEKASLSKAPEK